MPLAGYHLTTLPSSNERRGNENERRGQQQHQPPPPRYDEATSRIPRPDTRLTFGHYDELRARVESAIRQQEARDRTIRNLTVLYMVCVVVFLTALVLNSTIERRSRNTDASPVTVNFFNQTRRLVENVARPAVTLLRSAGRHFIVNQEDNAGNSSSTD